MPSKMNYATVIGAVNVDISGTPEAPLVWRDSNPGLISITYGGVGRNIAENIARLGLPVKFVTVLGNDWHAEGIRRHCRQVGIDLRHALQISDRTTSAYLCINDEKGDMQVAVNDMGIYELLTPEFLKTKLPLVNQGRLLVLDANIPQAAIEFLAENCQVPIMAEPVSSIKAVRLLTVLHKLDMIKPNRIEAEILSGVKIQNEHDLERAATVLLKKGVRHIFISLGREGVYYAGPDFRKKYANYPAQIINTTGCGDAFFAACVWGFSRKFDMDQITRLGLAAAAICIETPGAISPEMTAPNILQRMENNKNRGESNGT